MADTHRNKVSAGGILIVGDARDSLRVIAEMLGDEGYSVCRARNGAAALAMMDTHRPQLILLDSSTPDMDGFEVCRWLKSDGTARQIPVLFLANRDDTAEMSEAFKTGVQDVLTRPFLREEVLLPGGSKANEKLIFRPKSLK